MRSDNAQGELYLPDVVPIIRARERSVRAHEIDDASELGINDRVGLATVRAWPSGGSTSATCSPA